MTSDSFWGEKKKRNTTVVSESERESVCGERECVCDKTNEGLFRGKKCVKRRTCLKSKHHSEGKQHQFTAL